MRTLVLGVLTVTGLLGRARAENDSQTGLLGPREIAVGEGMRGGATGSTAISLNPSGLPLNRELVFEGGYGYRTGDSGSLVAVSACDSTNVAPGCFFYNYVRSDSTIPIEDGEPGDRSIHVAGMALSRLLVPRVSIGATAKYYRLRTDVIAEEDASGFVFDLGATVRLTELVTVGVAAQNLLATEKTPQLPRAIGAGLHARPVPILALGFDMQWKLVDGDHSVRYGGGAELFLRAGSAGGIPLRAGALHAGDAAGSGRTYVSGGIGYAALRWGIDVAVRHAVAGDDETLVIGSARFYGPRMASSALGGAD